MKTRYLFIILSLLATCGNAQKFQNPVIWADVPDPDLIRVGNDFYMVSTTMHMMPAAPIMHSNDLVNWRIVNYITPRMTDSPRYDLTDGTVYGLGQWATSLQYYGGRFYALFAPNDNPGETFIYTAKHPEDKWTLVSRLPHFHDAALFFDDDGRVYVFHGTGMVTELNPDLKSVKQDGVNKFVIERDAEENALLEGSRVIKKDGKYYVLMISWPNGGHRREVCYRSDKVTGPYEKKVILDTDLDGYYIGQGTIVDTPDGRWYGFIFQDRDAVGRVPTLEPCRWVDGWPLLGDNDGKVAKVMEKPIGGYEGGKMVTNDDFDDDKLKLEWQWNHNPIDEAWSLSARRGWMRLKTSRVVPNLFLAPNTLTQRMEGPTCTGTIKVDISHLHDGDVAGFAAFQSDAAVLSISRKGNKNTLTASEQSVKMGRQGRPIEAVDVKDVSSVDLDNDIVWLRIDADFTKGKDTATLSYSTDGIHFLTMMKDFKLRYDFTRLFMGTRFAIFNYATKATGGYVDIDDFQYSTSTSTY